MVATYNGWEDTPEEEREALDLWEIVDQAPGMLSRRARASVSRLSVGHHAVSDSP